MKAEVHRGVAPVAVWDSTVSLAETSEDDADRLLQRSFLESSGTDGTATLLSRYSGTAAAKSGSFSTVRSPAGVPDWLVVARSLQDVNGNPTRRPLTSATGNFASVLAITPVRLDNRPHLLPY